MQNNKQNLKFDSSFVDCFFTKQNQTPICEVESGSSNILSSPNSSDQELEDKMKHLSLKFEKLEKKDSFDLFQSKTNKSRSFYMPSVRKDTVLQTDSSQGDSNSVTNYSGFAFDIQRIFHSHRKNQIHLLVKWTHLCIKFRQLLVTDRSLTEGQLQPTSHIFAANSLLIANEQLFLLESIILASVIFLGGKQQMNIIAKNYSSNRNDQQQYQQQMQSQFEYSKTYQQQFSSQNAVQQQCQQFQYPTSFQQYQYHQQQMRTKKRKFEPQKETDQFKIDLMKVNSDPRTTLMIRNIPNKYTQPLLLENIDEEHSGTYDFFYLPIDFTNKCNVGYAFINFQETHHIPSFFIKFNCKKWDKFNSEKVVNFYFKNAKICEISYARIQGRNALLNHFKFSSIMNEDDKKVKPIFFHKEKLVSIQKLVQQQKEKKI